MTYFFKDTKCYYLNKDQILEELSNEEIEKYITWIEGISEKYHKIVGNSKLNKEEMDKQIKDTRLNFNMPAFLNKIGRQDLVQKIYEGEYQRYEFPLKGKIETHRDIETTIKTPASVPYIPGSSIKGAVRTAMACRVFDKANENEIWDLLKQLDNIFYHDKHKGKKALSNKLMDRVNTFCFNDTYKKGRYEKYNEAKYDLMKFIHISDAFPVNEKSKELLAGYVQYRYKKIGEKLARWGSSINLETVNPEQEFTFTINVDVRGIRNVVRMRDELEKKGRYIDDWVRFEKLSKRLFGIDARNIHNMNDNQIAQKVFETITKAINLFSRDLYDEETQWLEGLSDNMYLVKFYEKIDNLDNRLRIGQGSNFWSKTVGITNLLVRRKDEKLNDFVYDFFNKLIKHFNQRLKEPTADNFPITRAYVSNYDFEAVMPFGWVKIDEIK